MATPTMTEQIVAFLREGVSSNEIARRPGLRPSVVWGGKSHWRLRLYANFEVKDSKMTNSISSDDTQLILTLAEGIDPLTGEVLSRDHLLHNPQIVRALFHAARALERAEKSAKRVASLPAKAGASWSKEEDNALIQKFDSNVLVAEIAKRHGRTEGGITSRLVRLGKIAAREDAYNKRT
jgi:hypothetical protein